MPNRTLVVLAVPILILLIASGLLGGPAATLERDLVASLGLWRIDQPRVALTLVWLTHLGGSPVLVPLALAAAALLWWRGAPRAALLTAGVPISGRLMVELIKLSVDRPRPSFEPFPVYVSNQSFPSGHAANALMTYGALALFALPERWRAQGVFAAIALSAAIGFTRPALGVHWPSDVLGGWMLALLWLGLWWRVSRSGRSAA